LQDLEAELMLSDELEIKPELLVQFYQNTSIPLGQGLVESEAKDITCLSLLPVTEASECRGSFLSCVEKPSGEGGSRQRRDEGSDCTEASRVFVNSSLLACCKIYSQAKDSGNDFLSSESTDSSIPWILQIRELTHDSLIAATRAQLAKNAKTSSNGEIFWAPSSNGGEAKCTVEGCDQTFVRPAHFKYHLKTDRNDRSFICPAAGCGKSFYVLQRLKMGAAGSQEPEQTDEPLMGSRLLDEASVTSKNLVSMNSQPALGLTEGSPCPLSSVPDVTHHLVTMQSWRQPCEVSVSTAIDPQESLNQGDLTDRQT
ncbi:hypothetical protein E2I00_011046, partial [Balaenoptera physalus]